MALALASELTASQRDGVCYLDLAPLEEPRFIAPALAGTIGLEIKPEKSSGLGAALKAKQMLLVLDNCEHVVEAAATLVAGILAIAPSVRILATSREPLRIQGERVRRITPLAYPVPTAQLSASDALGFPAVRLFAERATASSDQFDFNDDDGSLIGNICSKLEGNPLAIEFAAARVDAFGLSELGMLLPNQFELLLWGHRTALSRHRSMRTSLDWSYELLSVLERVVFRRLAAFDNSFTLAEARIVAGYIFLSQTLSAAWQVLRQNRFSTLFSSARDYSIDFPKRRVPTLLPSSGTALA